MTDQFGSPAIPAAWYADPADARQLRYWDGRSWTAQVAPNPAAAPPPPPAVSPITTQPPAATQPPVATQPPQVTAATFAALFDEPQPSAYTPPNPRTSTKPRTYVAKAPSANTFPAWLYAALPLLLLPFAFLPLPVDLLNAPDLPLRGGLVGGFLLFAIVLPAIDGHLLRRREFRRTPPAILGVLPPVLSVTRVVSVGVRGLALVLLSLGLQAGVGYLLVSHVTAAPSATGDPADPLSSEGMVPPFSDADKALLLTPEGMAAKLMYDAQGTALGYESVQCQPLPSDELGAQTTCAATSKLIRYDIAVQLLPAGDGVPFTVVSVAPSLEF